jgi:hypothetical protein
VKKTDRIARELEQSVSTGVVNAKDWAAPRVEAAVSWAVPRLQHGIDSASPKIQEGLKSAAHNLADGVATVTPRIQDGLAQLAPKIHDAVEVATPRLHEALDKATPAINQARDRVVVEYLPRLSDQIGYASEAVHRTLESTPAHVDAVARKLGDVGIIHAVQEQTQTGGRRLKAAQLKALAKEAGKAANGKVSQPTKPRHRGLLILGVIAAAAAAGVAAWKASKPVEDPWKTPTPVTPAPVPAASVNEVPAAGVNEGQETADKAGSAGVGAAVTDTAADTSAGAAEKATDAAGEGKESTATVATDAKTAVQNIASSLKDKENGTSK